LTFRNIFLRLLLIIHGGGKKISLINVSVISKFLGCNGYLMNIFLSKKTFLIFVYI